MPALVSWWIRDLAQLGPHANPDAVQAIAAELLGRWAEPHRRYHRTRHLVEVFWAVGELVDVAAIDTRDGVLARVAGWFHDAVYDPGAPPGANEAASARLADQRLGALAVAPADVATVSALVLLTAAHEPTSSTGADRLVRSAFHDADLWILCAETARFDEYCAQVREEYAHVPEAAYRAGRSAILGEFARRPRLYATDHAHVHWEPSARVNLDRELARLAPENP
ncbi:MAG: hypothetical protein V9G08_02390 [Dermatophilaceae bacterium]